MNHLPNYSIRIIKNERDLTSAFSLRYEVYKKTFPLYTAGLQHPYETDEFDQRSIHIGVYYRQQNEEYLIGYSRFILPAAFAENFSFLLINEHPLYKREAGNNSSRTSFIKRLPAHLKKKLNNFWHNLEKDNISYCETGRFIITEQHRSISLSTFFVESMFAICVSLGIVYSFFNVTNHHIPFYKKFGLEPFPGIGTYNDKMFGEGTGVIFGTDLFKIVNNMPAISALVNQIKSSKNICLKKVA